MGAGEETDKKPVCSRLLQSSRLYFFACIGETIDVGAGERLSWACGAPMSPCPGDFGRMDGGGSTSWLLAMGLLQGQASAGTPVLKSWTPENADA